MHHDFVYKSHFLRLTHPQFGGVAADHRRFQILDPPLLAVICAVADFDAFVHRVVVNVPATFPVRRTDRIKHTAHASLS